MSRVPRAKRRPQRVARRTGNHWPGRPRRASRCRCPRKPGARGNPNGENSGEKKPMVGVEPTTPALRKPCSAIELHRRRRRSRPNLDQLRNVAVGNQGAIRPGQAPLIRMGHGVRGGRGRIPPTLRQLTRGGKVRKRKITGKTHLAPNLLDGMRIARYNQQRKTEQASTRRPPPSLRPEHPGRRSLLRFLFLCADAICPSRQGRLRRPT